ncbi:MAG: nucleotidyltransferase domain-containing protein, partial [Chloroflexi bacterium]|nr:nucleotidyltransferase domain-containing protein [Chloroflexota bacterium]
MILREVIGDAVLGVYLHGSAVMGGLRPTSDVDVLAVTARVL